MRLQPDTTTTTSTRRQRAMLVLVVLALFGGLFTANPASAEASGADFAMADLDLGAHQVHVGVRNDGRFQLSVDGFTPGALISYRVERDGEFIDLRSPLAADARTFSQTALIGADQRIASAASNMRPTVTDLRPGDVLHVVERLAGTRSWEPVHQQVFHGADGVPRAHVTWRERDGEYRVVLSDFPEGLARLTVWRDGHRIALENRGGAHPEFTDGLAIDGSGGSTTNSNMDLSVDDLRIGDELVVAFRPAGGSWNDAYTGLRFRGADCRRVECDGLTVGSPTVTVDHNRDGYQLALDGFTPGAVARYSIVRDGERIELTHRPDVDAGNRYSEAVVIGTDQRGKNDNMRVSSRDLRPGDLLVVDERVPGGGYQVVHEQYWHGPENGPRIAIGWDADAGEYVVSGADLPAGKRFLVGVERNGGLITLNGPFYAIIGSRGAEPTVWYEYTPGVVDDLGRAEVRLDTEELQRGDVIRVALDDQSGTGRIDADVLSRPFWGPLKPIPAATPAPPAPPAPPVLGSPINSRTLTWTPGPLATIGTVELPVGADPASVGTACLLRSYESGGQNDFGWRCEFDEISHGVARFYLWPVNHDATNAGASLTVDLVVWDGERVSSSSQSFAAGARTCCGRWKSDFDLGDAADVVLVSPVRYIPNDASNNDDLRWKIERRNPHVPQGSLIIDGRGPSSTLRIDVIALEMLDPSYELLSSNWGFSDDVAGNRIGRSALIEKGALAQKQIFAATDTFWFEATEPNVDITIAACGDHPTTVLRHYDCVVPMAVVTDSDDDSWAAGQIVTVVPATHLGIPGLLEGRFVHLTNTGWETWDLVTPVSAETYVSGAIPANALPAAAIPANALPAAAIPSNALPAAALPASALPAQLFDSGWTSQLALPAAALPAGALPAAALPAAAIPANALPAAALPAGALPAAALPAAATLSNFFSTAVPANLRG